jgi:hypothetical protein
MSDNGDRLAEAIEASLIEDKTSSPGKPGMDEIRAELDKLTGRAGSPVGRRSTRAGHMPKAPSREAWRAGPSVGSAYADGLSGREARSRTQAWRARRCACGEGRGNDGAPQRDRVNTMLQGQRRV